MFTIRDVARAAGVSVSTASLALRGDKRTSTGTRERVLFAAMELDYQPNNVAQSLKTGRTMTIGLIIPDILNPFFTVIAASAEDAACANGYSMVLCNSGNDAQREQGYLNLLRSRRVDGLIYMAGSSVPHAALGSLIDQGFPLVLIDEELEGIDSTSVMVRNYEGALALAEHIADLGHREIGVIGGPPELVTAQARLSAAIAGFARYGISVPSSRITFGDYQLESGRRATRALLSAFPEITAICAANDLMAIGAMQEAQSYGLQIPQDLSVTGFDDIPLASLVHPALTTVEQPTREMGRQAINLLLAQIGSRRPSARHVLLDPQLHIRDSVAAPRSSAVDRRIMAV